MTARQRKFAEEYVRDRDPRRAYKAAYPHIKSDKVADACAGRLLGDAKCRDVQEYIAELIDRATDEAVADAHEVLAYLSAVLRDEEDSETVTTTGGEGTEPRTVRKTDRIKAAELLAKYHQLLVPKVQVEAEGNCGLIVLQEATDGEP